ncbi:MAG: hypothetical protein V7641_5178 [Blastocatellia bacterium]
MKKPLVCLLLMLPFALLPAGVSADKAKPKKEKTANKNQSAPTELMTDEEFESKLKYQHGTIKLANGIATLNVPVTFRYLDADQAEKILVDAWGNPPGHKTLGMLFPADLSPLSVDGWGVVITYSEEGFVKDDDAESIDYNEMLAEMKKDTREDNDERKKQGYGEIDLVGWATPPHYDKASHKLYWARELRFGDAMESTLNYDIRVLGRKGVLSFNAVASMQQLNMIQDRMQDVLGFAQFTAGNQYTDFNPSVDTIAAYGIGALIAGKIALKVGFFKLLLGGLLALKKFIIIGLAALAALLRKWFGRKRDLESGETPTTTLNLK